MSPHRGPSLVALLALTACTGARFVEERRGPGNVTAAELHSELMSFTDTYTAVINEAWTKAIPKAPTLDSIPPVRAAYANARRLSHIRRLATVSSALSIAAGPNPFAGLSDLITMVSLEQRGLASSRAMFGDDAVAALTKAYAGQEAALRAIAARAMTAEQIEGLDECIEEWCRQNPDQRYVATIRLEDVARVRQQAATTKAVGSLFSLLGLDPLAGLDPAAREVQESRRLAERMFFYAGRMPTLMRWQCELAVEDIVRDPLIAQSLNSFATLAAAADRMSVAIDKLPDDLSVQRQAAIDEFFRGMTAQREGFLADLAASQSNLSGSLHELRSTIDASDRLAASVTTTLQAARALAERVMPTADAAAADAPPDVVDANGPDGLAEYQQAAQITGQTAAGLSRLAEQIERLLASPSWNQPAASVQTVVTEVEASTQRMIDRAFHRLVLLAALAPLPLLAAALVYLAFHRRSARAAPPPKP